MLLLCVPTLFSTYIVYVSANGSAGGDGTQGRPFASVSAAIDNVRSSPHESAKILLEPGIYRIEKPITIDQNDLTAPLAIEAADPSKPTIIEGGRTITGWQVQSNGWWTAKLPDVASGSWYFEDLFANNQRRFRPRWPSQGYSKIADEVPASAAANGKGYDRFAFAGNDINPNWANPDDLEIVLFHNWDVTVGRLGSVSGNQVTLKQPTLVSQPWQALPKGNRFFVENVKDALGAPGQWYLDRPTGVLTYVPKQGETPDNTSVIAPIAPRLLVVHGDIAQQRWAQHLSLIGLTFRHSVWNVDPMGRSVAQAESDLGGAIHFEGARDIAVRGCTVTQVGDNGIDIGASCKNVRVTDCYLTDTGAGGVKVGVGNRIDNVDRVTSNNLVENCVVSGFGRRAIAAIGIWVGQSPSNTVRHNTILDGYQSGISCGWAWGDRPSVGNHNTIDSNNVGNLGQNVMSDMGGIYTLGISPGTVIQNNFIHDIHCYSYGGWGIYLDEGSSDILIKNNIATRCAAGFALNYGKDNTVTNNIFAFNREAALMRNRPDEEKGFTLTDNIIEMGGGELLRSRWQGHGFAMDHNVFWRTDGAPIDFKGDKNQLVHFQDWQARGLDQSSVIADPQFVDAVHDDYRLSPNSPALKTGFVPFDMSGVGSTMQAPGPLPKAWP